MGGFKAAEGDREEAGQAHHMLLLKGIWEWCQRGDTTLHLLAWQRGLGAMQQEGEKPPHTEHPRGRCTWAGPRCVIAPRAMQLPKTNCW